MVSILFGNGFNRTLVGFPNWKDLLKSINPNIVSYNTTNILQYENIFAQAIDGMWFSNSKSTPEFLLKQSIANALRDDKWIGNVLSSKVYMALANCNAEHFLTTNYEGYLLDIFTKKYNVAKSAYNTEQIYSIRRCYEIDGGAKKYWPIHGEVRYPKTIMLGMDQYGAYLGKIDAFVKGNYDALPPLPNGKKAQNNISNRLAMNLGKPFSWVDLFFISDIHIIGLSLEYEEIDLWWLLTYRKRLQMKGINVLNHIIFHEPYTSLTDFKSKEDKHKMLTALNVTVDSIKISSNSFSKYYIDLLSQL